MRPSRRAPNPGILRKKVSTIRHSVDELVSGQVRSGILECQRAKAHIFETKPNPPSRLEITLMIIGSLCSARMPVLHGVTCKFGRKCTRHASRCPELGTQIHSHIMSKPNTNLP